MPVDSAILDFKELTADQGSSSVSAFTKESSSANGLYILQNPPEEPVEDEPQPEPEPITLEQVTDTIEYLLGTTGLEPGDGRIQRTLPRAHPMFPWMYVNAIPSVQGVGQFALTESDPELEAPPLPYYALYNQYAFKVNFGSVPYALLTDESIPIKSGFCYDRDGLSLRYTYAEEWLRFTDYLIEPTNDYIVPNQGQCTFRTTGGPAGPQNPNGQQFTNPPNMRLPNQLLKFVWYQVPYRYVTSQYSYLNSLLNTINQTDWYQWKKGQLLYLNYNVQRYTPPVPEVYDWYDGTVSTEKLCNIELQFLLTRRKSIDAPADADLPNRNFIPYGHNLLPWMATLKYYYATREVQGVSALEQTPMYMSAPFQLLCTDPDFEQDAQEVVWT